MDWRDRIVEIKRMKVSEIAGHPLNPRKHPKQQADALRGMLNEVGKADVLRAYTDSAGKVKLWDGHLRQDLDPDQEWWVAITDLTEQEAALMLVAFDPIAALAEQDVERLDALLRDVQTGDEALQAMLAQMAEDAGLYTEAGPEPEVETESALTRYDVPDAVWPTDNDWGIPLLDINLQATSFDQPPAIWGTTSRKARMNGTWLFYTEDYRYEALWSDPSPVVNSGAVNAVEPNFSCYENMPSAVAMWNIYRKRWIARWWQQYGLRIFADLNVGVPHYELNMMGIPVGWKAYATRGYTERIDCTHQEYEMACERAGTSSVLFLVYGGGKAVKAECQRMGWLWVQEDMDTGKGREV